MIHHLFSVPGANHQGSSSSYSRHFPGCRDHYAVPSEYRCLARSALTKPSFTNRYHTAENRKEPFKILESRAAVCFEVRHHRSLRWCAHLRARCRLAVCKRCAIVRGPRSLHNQQSGLPSCGSLVHDACIAAMAYYAKLCFSDCLGNLFLHVLKRYMLSSNHDSGRSKASEKLMLCCSVAWSAPTRRSPPSPPLRKVSTNSSYRW